MRFAFLRTNNLRVIVRLRRALPSFLFLIALLGGPALLLAAEEFEPRFWTDKKGNQLTSTFVDAKNGEVQLKNSEGQITKFKLADFAEPDQKYLRDLAAYRRKQAAGENPALPADPALASLDIQPLQTITDPVPEMVGFRKPLLDFPIRVWTDATGKKVPAKLVTAYNDKVVIDVKGSFFDLPIVKFSAADQQYVAVQLKSLQRDDLTNVLAKAIAATKKQPDGSPAPVAPPTAVAANTPPPMAAPLGTDDIRARLEQLKAQREGNPDPGTQAVLIPVPTLNNDDLKQRLAKIREEKGEPEPAFIPAPAVPVYQAPPPVVPIHGTAFEPPPIPMPSGPTMRMIKKCMSCNREVPGNLTAGDKCPHCGVFFGRDMTTGKTAKDPTSVGAITGYISAGLFILVCLGKLFSKFSGN